MSAVVRYAPTEEQVDEFLAVLRKTLLADDVRDVEIRIDRGHTERDNWETQLVEFEDNGTRTITIRVNGGASDHKGPPIGAPDSTEPEDEAHPLPWHVGDVIKAGGHLCTVTKVEAPDHLIPSYTIRPHSTALHDTGILTTESETL